MNRVDAAVIRDLRNAALAFQQKTLYAMFTTPPAERPVSETNRNNPIPSNTQDNPTKGLTP